MSSGAVARRKFLATSFLRVWLVCVNAGLLTFLWMVQLELLATALDEVCID